MKPNPLEDILLIDRIMAVKLNLNSTQLSLRWILMFVFGIQLFAAVGMVGWLSFRHGQKAIEKMAQQLSLSVSHEIEHHLTTYLNQPHQLLQIKASAVKSGTLDLTNVEGLQQDFRYLLQTQNQINQIFFQNPNGDYIQVNQPAHFSPNLQYSHSRKPTQLPSQPTWNVINQDIKTATPTMNALTPLFNADDEFLGVMGIEVKLSQLSQFLQNLQRTPSVKAFILDRSGTAIAPSTHDSDTIPSISDVAIAHLNQKLSSIEEINHIYYSQFEFEGKQQLLHILPFNDSYGLDWFVMVVIPITDFTDTFQEQTKLTIFLCGITLGLIATLALLTARWISAPLHRLSLAADAMIADQPLPPFKPMGIKELNRLGDCFNQMIQQVKQTQQVLESDVQERTQQLNASNQKFATVFRYSPVAMCILRIADDYILDVNEAFTDFLGYSREQAIGYTSQDLDVWVDPQDRNQLIEQLRSRGSVAHYETQMRAQSAEVIDVEMFGTVIEVDHQPCLLLAGCDLTQRKRGETERDLYENRLQMQQIVMMELSKSTELQAGDLIVALKKLTMMIAHLLDIDRVSIWFYNDNQSGLRCANLYQLHSRQHSSNQTLSKTDLPNYFNAIATQPLIVIDHVETDPHLQDLYVSHLKPLGVRARLDVAICSEGKTVGILSLEQVDRPRQWLIEEQNFAAYFAHLIALAIEARDHAEAEAALRASEQRFRQLAENIEKVFWMLDPQTQEILYISPAYEKIWGRSCEQLYTFRDAFLEAVYPEDRSIIINTKTQNINQPQEIEYRIIRPDGEIRWIRDRAFPIYNDSGELYRVAGIAEDVTQDKQAAAALRRSQERLQLALEAAENGLWDWNLTSGELYISPQALQMLGYGEEEFTGSITQWQEIIHPEDKPWVLERLNQHLTQNSGAYAFDYRLRTRCGQWKWMANYGKVVERDTMGNPVRMTGVQQDITERKKVEEKLQTSLREKEVLLREIHHRVKNNLHIISSLLDLQSDILDNEQLIEIFADSQNRIRSMALIHEQLYQSPDLGQVEFGEYIHRLMNNIVFCFSEHLNDIQPIIEVDSVYLNIETAIPCGLLINEIITNAFKHAFPQNHSGKIHVQFSQQDQQLTLVISDNGVGISKDIEWQKSSTLGLRLVKILSQQLKAKVQTDFSQGTYFQFIFLPLEYRRRF
ncbi:MAG: PAS domain-containing protein [Microcoleaceae cyanobacterium]